MRGVLLLNGESVYSVLSRQAFFSRWLRLVKYGTDSLAFLARKIRKLVPNDTKNLGWLKAFKSAIKKLKPKDCCYSPIKDTSHSLALCIIIWDTSHTCIYVTRYFACLQLMVLFTIFPLTTYLKSLSRELVFWSRGGDSFIWIIFFISKLSSY